MAALTGVKDKNGKDVPIGPRYDAGIRAGAEAGQKSYDEMQSTGRFDFDNHKKLIREAIRAGIDKYDEEHPDGVS